MLREFFLRTVFIGPLFSFSSLLAQVGSGEEVYQAWIAQYNGPASGEDVPVALATDSSGNVYVTGYSQGLGTGQDIVILKYSADGVLLWERRYNGSDNLADAPSGFAVDGDGDVYITGFSTSLLAGTDFVTLKYSANGSLLWAILYNGSGNSADKASNLALEASGNVYVTGTSTGNGTAEDYLTLKYNPNGSLLWEKRYNGPASNADNPSALALDNSGNVHVTGSSWGGSSWDMATLKYDSNGNLLWVRRHFGGRDADVAADLAVDAAANAYVTGKTSIWGSNSNYRFLTIKYNTGGNLIWSKTYQGYSSNHSIASALTLDASGNVCITGSSWGIGTSYDFATVKYDPSGNQLWAQRFDGPSSGGDISADVAADVEGNVFVTGSRYKRSLSDKYDFVTLKYSPSGQLVWVKIYSAESGADQAVALWLDRQSNLLVAGWSQGGTTSKDIVTLKYSLCTMASPKSGDANADGRLSLSDVVAMINYIFQKPGYPFCSSNSYLCWLSGLPCRGDWNGNSQVSLSDVLRGINYLFGKPGGPWEPLPSGACCPLLP